MHLQRRGMYDLVQAPHRGHHHQRQEQPHQSGLCPQLAACRAGETRAQPCPAGYGLREGKACRGGGWMGAGAGHRAGFSLRISSGARRMAGLLYFTGMASTTR